MSARRAHTARPRAVGRRAAALAAAVIVAAAALAASPPAAAVGLGALEVQSGLNEPFRARIPLAGLAPGEAALLTARLAGDDAYARFGLERGLVAPQLRFRAVASGERGGHVLITGDALLREPVFSFILEVDGSGGTVQRRYDVVLELR